MKAALFDLKGTKKKEMEMPAVFSSDVREDIILKYVEADRYWHPHSPYAEAGKRHSASGTISHKRHDWKGQYGKGISRTPRKALWRRGVQFNWVGAEVSNTRGGRRVHHSHVEMQPKKINKKEMEKAFAGAFAATAQKEYIIKRYQTVNSVAHELPLVIESKLEGVKAKEFMIGLKKMLGNLFTVALSKKAVRAGKGKARGRRYKASAGLLLVTGAGEKIKMQGIEVKHVKDVAIGDLYPLGRLTVYTEKALEELK